MRQLLALALATLLTACGSVERSTATEPQAILTAARPIPTETAIVGEPEGRVAVFPNTIVVYREEGPAEASTRQWTIYHTGRVLASDGKETQAYADGVDAFFETVESQAFWALTDSYGPPGGCPDCLVRTITVYHKGQIKDIRILDDPGDLPKLLAQALEEAIRLIRG